MKGKELEVRNGRSRVKTGRIRFRSEIHRVRSGR
jgi:hypothetical protein